MENVSFQPSGEEIERALMDLGPLLGVTIKEEVADELAEVAAPPSSTPNVSSTPDGSAAGAEGAEGSAGAEGAEGKAPAADSLAAGAPRAPAAPRCVLCNVPLAQADGTPKLMECLHSACENCIKAKIEEKHASSRDFLGAERVTVMCPACRLQCQVANMIDQRFVLEKMSNEQASNNGAGAGAGEQQCNSCDDTEPATSYCVDCAEFICDNCVHAHQRLKITKDHTIKSKEDALAELHAQAGASAHDMFCAEHVQERLSLFCETCDRLTCRDCQLHHHRDHKYQFSTEMAAQARANISSLVSEVSYKRVLLGSAMQVIRDRQLLIADKKKALVHEITQTVVKLTNAINTRGKQLVLRLNEVCDAKQRTLTEKKEALEQLAAITDHCVDFVSGALHTGSDTAILHSKRAVVAQLARIKARRADIPNPEIPVRIGLALDKLPDLIRVLSSIGAIVVDGKVDGGATGAQGPYHPPQQQQQQQQQQLQQQQQQQQQLQQQNQHPSVVALQHAVMQQSFVGGGVGGAGGAGGVGGGAGGAFLALGGARARSHTPLRHPHVTSTTHPHHLQGMNDMNLRGLLNASGGARARALPPAHAQHAQLAMHHAYMLNAYNGGSFVASGRRSAPRTPSPAPPAYPHPHHQLHHQQQQQQQQQLHQQQAKWHIPQHALANGGSEASAACMGGGAEYKITLGRRPPTATVTSTNPKTPSPNLNGGCGVELDKVCAASVQDLLATIAKLDSNGVQVVPEAASPAPPVHSSTDPRAAPAPPARPPAPPAQHPQHPQPAQHAPDPNDDWCAVCMDGGELMCCDNCPKVFHQYCHLPAVEKLPDENETWQCLLCVNFAEIPEQEGGAGGDGAGLSAREQKLVERITLELYCQYEPSLAFREPVPPDNLHYHSKISRPMCLDSIRMKLQPRSPLGYSHVSQFVQDCRLLFRNAYAYNPPDSQIYKDAKRLEEFFDAQLVKWLPEYAYWAGDGDPPAKRARTH